MPDYGVIASINGPVVTVRGALFSMSETVYVGEERLIGEVIRISSEIATIQVFEDTYGLKIGEKVYKTNKLLSVTLGPGLITNIFDGIERPLNIIAEQTGEFID